MLYCLGSGTAIYFLSTLKGTLSPPYKGVDWDICIHKQIAGWTTMDVSVEEHTYVSCYIKIIILKPNQIRITVHICEFINPCKRIPQFYVLSPSFYLKKSFTLIMKCFIYYERL